MNVPENTEEEIEVFDDKVREVEEKHGQVAPIARGLLAIKAKEKEFVARNIDQMTTISKSTVYLSIQVGLSMDLIEHVDENKDTDGRNAKIYEPTE
jgi:predicted transcriptional regulator